MFKPTATAPRTVSQNFCNPALSTPIPEVKPTLEDQIQKAQKDDPEIKHIKLKMEDWKFKDFTLDDQGTLWINDPICVPDQKELK